MPIPKKRVRGKDTIHKSKGVTTGIGICSFLTNIFEANELSKKKLTDEQIAERAVKEFPTNRSATNLLNTDNALTVNAHRNKYNRGGFTRGIPPEQPSFRYNKRNQRVDGRTGKYKLLPEEIEKLIKDHQTKRQRIIDKLNG